MTEHIEQLDLDMLRHVVKVTGGVNIAESSILTSVVFVHIV